MVAICKECSACSDRCGAARQQRGEIVRRKIWPSGVLKGLALDMVIVLTFLLTGAICNVQAADLSVTEYRKLYDTTYVASQAAYERAAASGLGDSYYSFQYAFEATLSIYEASKDPIYLERALIWAETMVARATIVDENGNRNWAGLWKSSVAPAPIAYQLEDFQGSTGLARLCGIIMGDSVLKERYSKRVLPICEYVKSDVIDKHLYRRKGEGSLLADAWNRKVVFDDRLALLIRCMVPVFSLGENRYQRTLTSLAQAFRSRFESYRGAVIWDRGLGEGSHTATDTSHGNRYPYAALDLYRAGIVFSREDIQGLSSLFTRVIWNRSWEDPRFSNFIDGSNGEYRQYKPWGAGLIYAGWVTLGQVDSEVQTVGSAVVSTLLAGKSNPSVDGMDNMYGRLALAGHLAKNIVVLRGSR